MAANVTIVHCLREWSCGSGRNWQGGRIVREMHVREVVIEGHLGYLLVTNRPYIYISHNEPDKHGADIY